MKIRILNRLCRHVSAACLSAEGHHVIVDTTLRKSMTTLAPRSSKGHCTAVKCSRASDVCALQRGVRDAVANSDSPVCWNSCSGTGILIYRMWRRCAKRSEPLAGLGVSCDRNTNHDLPGSILSCLPALEQHRLACRRDFGRMHPPDFCAKAPPFGLSQSSETVIVRSINSRRT